MAWPATDSFDDGDPFVDSYSPFAWARCVPWTSDSSTGFGTAMLAFEQVVYLYDGWYTSPPPVQMLGSPSATPLVCTNQGADQEEPSCFIFRDYVTTDGSVEISFNEAAFQGNPLSISWRSMFMGVGMRIGGGGSVLGGGVDSTTIVRSVQGYWAFLAWATSIQAAPKWILVRTNGTSATQIASATATTSLNVRSSRRIRMRVEDTTAGDPRIIVETASVLGFGSITYETLIDFTDSSANKITDPGRVGFMTTSEQAASITTDGIARAYLVNWLSVKDADAETEIWREDGSRVSRAAGLSVSSALKPGRCIQGAWFSDLYTTGTLTPMRQDIGNNRITFDGSETGSSASGFYVSQRPATDPINQDRSAQFVFVSGGGSPVATRSCGVAVRVSNIDTPGDDVGFAYYATLERDDSDGSGLVALYRKRTNDMGGTQLRIMASKTATLNENTSYRLRVQISNTATNDYPQIKVYLNGSQVVLEQDATFPSIQVDSNGTVLDPISNAILSGPAEALYIDISDAVAHTIAVNDWTQEAGAASGELAEQNQASISVRTETLGATGTLTVPVDWDIKLTRTQEVRAHSLEGGYVYAGAADTFQRRRWDVGQEAATEDEVLSLRTFRDEHRGAEIPFYWTPPGASSAIIVHFVDGTLTDRLRAPGVYSFGFTLEELTSGS